MKAPQDIIIAPVITEKSMVYRAHKFSYGMQYIFGFSTVLNDGH